MMKADQIAAFCAAAGNVKAGAAEWVKAQGKMDPDVFVLYRGDDNKYMLTRFGAKEHHKADGHSYSKTDLFLYKCRKNFLYAYSERYVEYGINPDDYDGVVLFENKGMYAVSEEQARVLMEKNDDKAFFDTLEAVVKSEDMTALKLTPEAQKERNSFLRKSLYFARSVFDKHNKEVEQIEKTKEKESLRKRKEAEREKAQKDTKKFLKVFSRFGPRER